MANYKSKGGYPQPCYVGDVFTTNNNGDCKVIEYNGCKEVSIEFLKTGTIKTVHARSLKTGSVSDPNNPTVVGIGYIGQGKYKTRENKKQTKANAVWCGMLDRCYGNRPDKAPSYKNVTVCEDWHNYQKYAEWYDKNIPDGFDVDKDLLCAGREYKIYSPETCVGLPAEINRKLITDQDIEKDLPLGVKFNKNRKNSPYPVFVGEKYIRSFSCPDLAHEAYCVAKNETIHNLAQEYKEKLPQETYEILLKYNVKDHIRK